MKKIIEFVCFVVFIILAIQTCNNCNNDDKKEDKQEQTTPAKKEKTKKVMPKEDIQPTESEATEEFSNDGDDEAKPNEEDAFVNENE